MPTFFQSASGGIIVDGNGIDQLVFTGEAGDGVIAGGEPIMNVNGIGGGANGDGTASVSSVYYNSVDGGVLVDGSNTQSFGIAFSGGAVANGSGSDTAIFTVTTSDGAIAGGDGSPANVITATVSGGVLADGAATISVIVLSNGGAIADGAASFGIVLATSVSGGVRAGGTVSSNTVYNVAQSGGALAGGIANVSRKYIEIGHGGVITDSTSIARLIYNFVPTGTVWANGRAIVLFDVLLSKQFTWNVGPGVLRWYRIEGECSPKKCPVFDDSTDQCSQGSTNIMNVLADNEADIIDKILARGWSWPIKSIKVYTIPAMKSDNINNLTCNGLTDITSRVINLYNQSSTGCKACATGTPQTWTANVLGQTLVLNKTKLLAPSFANINLDSTFCIWGANTNFNVPNCNNVLINYVQVTAQYFVGQGSAITLELYNTTTGDIVVRYTDQSNWDATRKPDCLIPRTMSFYTGSCSNLRYDTATITPGAVGSDLFATENLDVSIGIGAEAIFNAYIFNTSGSISMSGTANVSSANSPTILISGSAGVKSTKWNLGMSGHIAMSGAATVNTSYVKYYGGGSIHLSGSSSNSNSYNFSGGGSIRIGGSGGFTEPGIDNLDCETGLVVSLTSEIHYAATAANTLAAGHPSISVTCCDALFPDTLYLTHNLNNCNNLSQFLLRNNLALPTNITLRYDEVGRVWQENLYYKGYAYSVPQRQTWSIYIEFGCITQLGTSDLGDGVWRFSVYIKSHNLDTGMTSDTRFLTFFAPLTLCPNVNFSSFTFQANTTTKAVSPTTVLNVVLNDDARLFFSPIWIKNPILKFGINTLQMTAQNTTDYPEITLPINNVRALLTGV